MELPLELRRRVAQLTPKEQACLRLVSQRLSSKEIGAHLGISKTSVDTYCNRARAKLDVADRFEAARALKAVDDAQEGAAERAIAASSPSQQARRRLAPIPVLMTAAALVAIGIGLAALLAGLRAIDKMRPGGVVTNSVRGLG